MQSAADNAGCKPSSGFGVVGCIEYVLVEDAAQASGVVTGNEFFPLSGKVQPIGLLDSASDPLMYFQNYKVGGSDVVPDYGGTDVFARRIRIADQDAEAWRAGINLFGAVPVVIDPNIKLTYDIDNAAGVAAVKRFYLLNLRVE